MQCGSSLRLEVQISRVDNAEDFSSFHCGVKEMDSFIHEGLRQSVDNHFCVFFRSRF